MVNIKLPYNDLHIVGTKTEQLYLIYKYYLVCGVVKCFKQM